MKASQIKMAIETMAPVNQPLFIWGPPGVGKSQVVIQAAASMGRLVEDVRAVLLDPVDLRGLPTVNGDGRAHWAIPDFLPRNGEGILFLDELNAAPPLVQAACYQLVLDRKLGNYTLPGGWAVIAAGNRETDKAVTHRMPSPLANRFQHLEFDVDLDDWVAWALNAGVMTEVIAFLRFRPALLHDFDPKRADKAFPTPRSWEFVSKTLGQNPPKEIEYELIKGTVGEGAAAELLGFLRICRKLPNPDTILMDPDNAPVSDDPATLYAVCGALARKASANTIDRLIRYYNRLPAEFNVLAMRDSQRQSPDVVNSRGYIQWASDHNDVLI